MLPRRGEGLAAVRIAIAERGVAYANPEHDAISRDLVGTTGTVWEGVRTAIRPMCAGAAMSPSSAPGYGTAASSGAFVRLIRAASVARSAPAPANRSPDPDGWRSTTLRTSRSSSPARSSESYAASL